MTFCWAALLLLLTPVPPSLVSFVAADEIGGRPANLRKGPLVKRKFCIKAREAEAKKKTCTAPGWKYMKTKDNTGASGPINFVTGVCSRITPVSPPR